MSTLALIAYAFAVGLTLSGLAGSALELALGRRLGLRPPFVSREHIASSLALTLVAGPLMLANEALAARRRGLIGAPLFAVYASLSAAWALATGILTVELALVSVAAVS